MDEEYAKALGGRYEYLVPRKSEDCPSFSCPADKLAAFAKAARDREGYEMLVDATAVDWGEEESPRFTSVYHLYSLAQKNYLRVSCDCEDDEEPEAPSLAGVYPSADWHERETFDMFGIRFTDHPNLKRILMWDDYPYFPLRKEFPLAGIETPLPAADVAEVTEQAVDPAPMMGGPFVASPSGTAMEVEPRAKDESWTEESEKPL